MCEWTAIFFVYSKLLECKNYFIVRWSLSEPQNRNRRPSPVANIPHHNSNDGDRGDFLVRGLWRPGIETIIDVRSTNLDNKSQISRSSETILKQHEKERRDK